MFNDSVTIVFTVTDANPDVRKEDIHWQFQPLMSNEYLTISHGLSFDHRSLTISNLLLNHSGNYTIFAANNAGTAVASVSLNVYGKVNKYDIKQI